MSHHQGNLTNPYIFLCSFEAVSSCSLIWASSLSFAFVKSFTLDRKNKAKHEWDHCKKSQNMRLSNVYKIMNHLLEHKVGPLVIISVLEFNKFPYFFTKLLLSLKIITTTTNQTKNGNTIKQSMTHVNITSPWNLVFGCLKGRLAMRR